MKFSDKTRDVIKARAKMRCELCGAMTRDGQIHHRQPRGMGGSLDRRRGAAANGLYVHPKCHERIESFRSVAYHYGWLVSSNDDPRLVPVKLWDGWWRLGDSGEMTKVERS